MAEPSSLNYRVHIGWYDQTWTDVNSIYASWELMAQGHAAWGSVLPGHVPGVEVLAIQIDRNAGDLFDRPEQGRADILIDNTVGDFSPGNNPAVRVNQPVAVIADLVNDANLLLEDRTDLLLQDTLGAADGVLGLEDYGIMVHYPLFYGSVFEIKGSTELGKRRLRVEAEDHSAILRNRINGSMQIDTIVSSLVDATLNDIGFEPSLRRIGPAQDRVSFAWYDDDRGGDALDRIIKSGAHYFFVNGKGQAVFEDRNWQEAAPIVGFYREFESFETYTQDEFIRNVAGITAQPRRLATDPRTVASIDRAVQIDPGVTAELYLDYVDVENALESDIPVVSLQTLVAGTNYTIGTTETQSEGGTDLSSASISSLTLQSLGRKALVTVSHIHSKPAYLQSLYIDGRPLQRVGAIEQQAKDQASIDKFGELEKRLENDIIRSRIHAQAYAEWIVDRYKDGVPEAEFTLANRWPDILQLEPIQRVSLVNSFSGVNSDFLVVGASHTIRFDSSGREHRVSYALRRANPGNYFVLDDSLRGELDGTNYVLGF